MKPDINIALLNAAQEIINRFSPLIEDEYERSRLGSWGALILISAMKLNDASSELKKENTMIIEFLLINSAMTDEDVTNLGLLEENKSLDSADQDNQKLRELLDEEIQRIEKAEDVLLFANINIFLADPSCPSIGGPNNAELSVNTGFTGP